MKTKKLVLVPLVFLFVLIFSAPSRGQWVSTYGFKRIILTGGGGIVKPMDSRFGNLYEKFCFEYGGSVSLKLFKIMDERCLYGVFSYNLFNNDFVEDGEVLTEENRLIDYNSKITWKQEMYSGGLRCKWFMEEHKQIWLGTGFCSFKVLEKANITEEALPYMSMDKLVNNTFSGLYVEGGYTSVVISPFSVFVNLKFDYTFKENYGGLSVFIGTQIGLFDF